MILVIMWRMTKPMVRNIIIGDNVEDDRNYDDICDSGDNVEDDRNNDDKCDSVNNVEDDKTNDDKQARG